MDVKMKQITGQFKDGAGGFCELGLLEYYHTNVLIDVRKDFKEGYSRYWITYRDNVEV